MRVEFFFDFSCPYAYLGSTQIEALCARAGAELVWKPMLLGGVFRAVGTGQNMASGMPPAKAAHNFLDMHRWASLWNVPMTMPPAHPMRTVAALRALLSVDESRWPPLIKAIYEAYWVRSEDISDPSLLAAALARGGLDPSSAKRALEANDDPSLKEELIGRTDEALARGVFGAPAMFIGEELYWGQDRLGALAQALGSEHPVPAFEAPSGDATIDFFYDFSSPFAYLASTEIERIAADAGAVLRFRPFLLGAVFNAIGTANVPIAAFSPPKQLYYRADLFRWAKARNVALSWNRHFPLKTVTALRLALIAPEERAAELTHRIFRAVWADDQNVDDETLAGLLAELGLEASLLARASEPDSKAALRAATDEALARGVFGAPTAIVSRPGRRDELFWGQDRLDLVRLCAAGRVFASPL